MYRFGSSWAPSNVHLRAQLLGSFGRGYCDRERVSQNGLMNIDNSVAQDSCICGGILPEGGGGAFGFYLHTWCNVLKVSTGSEEGRYGKSWCCEKNRRNPPFENSFVPSISRRAFLFICDGTNVIDVTSYAFGASRWENLKGKNHVGTV